ncbi:hypothetical protein AN958_09591 [Leucoagaricus sp. SymC.cos]|nr:hypothetical protein AN958_09591 [Leucoagaricus sp. SymC.cos]
MTKLRPNSDNIPKPWPRIGCCIQEDILFDATKQIYCYVWHDWQLRAFYKVAEGHDVFALAGTGYGKSLVYGLLAIAAAIVRRGGTAVVISLLKALEVDQVQCFHGRKFTITLEEETLEIEVMAVAINEDNNDPNSFVDLEKGRIRLLFASPECFLPETRLLSSFFANKVSVLVYSQFSWMNAM